MGDAVSLMEPGGNAFAGQRGVAHTEAEAARGAQRTLEAECENWWNHAKPTLFALTCTDTFFLLFGCFEWFLSKFFGRSYRSVQMIPVFFVQIQSKHDETGRPFVTSGVTGMSIRGTPTVAIASKGVCAGLAKIKIHSDGLRITELPLLQMQRPRCSWHLRQLTVSGAKNESLKIINIRVATTHPYRVGVKL